MLDFIAYLPVLNLLLFPGLAALWRLSTTLATMAALQGEHSRRLASLEDGQRSMVLQRSHERATA